MKIKYSQGKRKGQVVDVLDSAAERIVASGVAESVESKPAKKATSKKTEGKDDADA